MHTRKKYIRKTFGPADLRVNGKFDWKDKVKDKCGIVFYVNNNGYASHTGLFKYGKPYKDTYGSTKRAAHIWFLPCICKKRSSCKKNYDIHWPNPLFIGH